MSGIVRERFTPHPLAADAGHVITGDTCGGFLAVTAGTITITANTDLGVVRTIVAAYPVAAGSYNRLPFYVGKNGGFVQLAGGASGTFFT